VKPTDHHVEGSWLVTELRGNLGHRAIVDEESAQCFIPAMKSQLGVEEEATAELTIHDSGSHQSTVFCPPVGLSLPPNATPGKAAPEAANLGFEGRIAGVRGSHASHPTGFENAELRAKHAKNN
jgi:hypothetical protein